MMVVAVNVVDNSKVALDVCIAVMRVDVLL